MGFFDDLNHADWSNGKGLDKAWNDLTQTFGASPQQSGPLGMQSYNDPSKTALAAPNAQQAQGMDPAQQAQFRQFQMGLANQLQQQARGLGPSLAAEQARQNAETNAAQARGMLLNQRGVNPALAGYLAQGAAANAAQAGNMAAVQGRMQEQLNAQQGLAALAGQGREGDLSLGQAQQQNNQFNANQLNQLLAQDAQQRNQAMQNQNQQIANADLQRQNANLNFRNQFANQVVGAGTGLVSKVAAGAAMG